MKNIKLKISSCYGKQDLDISNPADVREMAIYLVKTKIQKRDPFFIMLIVSLKKMYGKNLNLMKKHIILKIEFGLKKFWKKITELFMNQKQVFIITME